MKITLVVLLSGLLLYGCSNKQAASESRAIDLVVAGKDVTWGRGAVLHIAKRDGSSVEGVQLLLPRSDGQNGMITADTATLVPGSDLNASDDSCVQITLHNAQGVDKKEVTFVLHKQ
ncbi:MAG: hypothetical protein P4L87_21430 [Formivibrio sp.]|nr:hypothetical protein [Formivibrio sp.]